MDERDGGAGRHFGILAGRARSAWTAVRDARYRNAARKIAALGFFTPGPPAESARWLRQIRTCTASMMAEK